MKDSYSFDIDDAGLDASYQAHRGAYLRIFERLGLEVVTVRQPPAPWAGPRARSSCTPPRSARTPSSVPRRLRGERRGRHHRGPAEPIDYADAPAAEIKDTPDTPTIETLVAAANQLAPRADGRVDRRGHAEERGPGRQAADGRAAIVVIGVPGDRAVDLKRVEANIGASCRWAAKSRSRPPPRRT